MVTKESIKKDVFNNNYFLLTCERCGKVENVSFGFYINSKLCIECYMLYYNNKKLIEYIQ